ncbi:FRG domain-containing protein [Thermomonas brevis]|uniref:FRG domain-containing protein n=1 Tax=Thermomonas brevis TaxID=215691 RepID=UPI001CB75B12|nr:FRG domain-containing protein [Thermomonas brevis]
MHVGRLKAVKLRNNGSLLYIQPELDLQIPPIPFDRIEPLQMVLDIRNWELNRTHWAIKDEDLFEVLRTAGLMPARMPSLKVSKADLPPALIPEFQANSVSSFIKNVLDIDHHGCEVFYRGHSNRAKYRLEPSILRKDDRGNFIYRDAEDRMYRELLVSNSVDFHGDVYTLDRLVRMQHYSLPARLLDITSNPLIALYFACKSNPDDDGEVVVFSMERSQIKYFDPDTASCIANLTRLPQDSKESIDYSSNDLRKFTGSRPSSDCCISSRKRSRSSKAGWTRGIFDPSSASKGSTPTAESRSNRGRSCCSARTQRWMREEARRFRFSASAFQTSGPFSSNWIS